MEQNLRIKVGALVIVALLLLGGFIAVLTSVSLGEQITLYVEFTDSGSMLRGAPVKIAGVRAGQVTEVEFLIERGARKSEPKAEGEAAINVRVTAEIDAEMAHAVRHDSEFFITTQGVLGEKYLEIIPGTDASPTWADGAHVRGNDPPRVDLLFAKAQSIMDQIDSALSGGGEYKVGEMIAAFARLATTLDDYLTKNRERLDRVTVNIETASSEAAQLLGYLREGVGSGEDVQAMMADVKRVTQVLARDVEPTLRSARGALNKADAAIEVVRGVIEGNKEKVEETLAKMPDISEKARAVLTDAAFITAGLTQGRGTVGQLIVDQELYDDLKEMLRDLKRHPWKMLWRE